MRALILLSLIAVSGCHSLVIVRGPNRNADLVEVEVDWTTPSPPPTVMLRAVEAQIKRVCDPAVTVTFKLDDDLSRSAKGKWSNADLQLFPALHSHAGSDAFYLLWADGQMADNPSVGGYSWGTRCFAVFPSVFPNQTLMQNATAHEFFHNIGLVDKALVMQKPHKHSYGNHCDQQACIMYPLTSGASSPCQLCVADLEAGEEK